MWDLTVPGNNDHDFYVTASEVAVLVHNCGPQDLNYNQIRQRIASHAMLLHGFGMPSVGAKFAEHLGEDELLEGLTERISPDNATGVIDRVRSTNGYPPVT
jgi:hypothetical protein